MLPCSTLALSVNRAAYCAAKRCSVQYGLRIALDRREGQFIIAKGVNEHSYVRKILAIMLRYSRIYALAVAQAKKVRNSFTILAHRYRLYLYSFKFINIEIIIITTKAAKAAQYI